MQPAAVNIRQEDETEHKMEFVWTRISDGGKNNGERKLSKNIPD